MAWVLRRPDHPVTIYRAKPASTAFTKGDLCANNADADDNTFDAMTATSPQILGVIQKTIAATDSDYADETKIPILIDVLGVWEVPVDTGTADANDEGGFIDVDNSTPETGVDVTASVEDHCLVMNFVSGTVVQVMITTYAHVVPPVHAS